MKIKITIILFFAFFSFAVGQNQNENLFAYYESLNLGVGYSYSFGEPHKDNFHLVEIGINKAKYGGRHGGGFQYGIGTEIGLNTASFMIGPKISGILYYQFFSLGTELVTYTDFDNWTLRFVPFFGIGSDKFRLTINPHVILANKEFQPINKGLINLSINFALERQQLK